MFISRLVNFCLICGFLLVPALTGCRRPVPDVPDYGRPLPPGAFGLRRVTDPSRLPDLSLPARQLGVAAFREALARSVDWFTKPSTRQFFPTGPISHAHAHTSVYAMHAIAESAESAAEAKALITDQFDVWESIGWDGSGIVLFTAYYTPVFDASRTKTSRYRYPLYRRPPDLLTDPVTGEVVGQQTGGGIAPYPSRAQIEQTGLVAGLELVYLPNRFDAYIVEINGSAKLRMTDGTTMYVGYDGTNGHDYSSIGRLLVEQGKIDRNRLSLSAIRSYFRAHPGQLEPLIRQNDRFVFFGEYGGDNWPAGSLGFRVTADRSLATDKAIFPRGSVVLAATTVADAGGQPRSFNQLMLDQDTGGAIRAAGRADIYLGIGPQAQQRAGRQLAEGRLYYLLLKPDRAADWYERMVRRTSVRGAE